MESNLRYNKDFIVFNRLPYTGNYISITKYKLKSRIENYILYIVENRYLDFGISDFYWTTNLKNKIVRGIVSMLNFSEDCFKNKIFKSFEKQNLNMTFQESLENAVWHDIEVQTSYDKDSFEIVECEPDFKNRFSIDYKTTAEKKVNEIINYCKDDYLKALKLIRKYQETDNLPSTIQNFSNRLIDFEVEEKDENNKKFIEFLLNFNSIINKDNLIILDKQLTGLFKIDKLENDKIIQLNNKIDNLNETIKLCKKLKNKISCFLDLLE